MSKSKLYERNGKKWQVLTDSITTCLCKDMVPIYTVEKDGFRNMLKKFDSQYEIPSRKYFSGTAIPKMYGQVRERVAGELSNVKYYAATILTSWSSEPYLCYTVHFVDDEWSLKSRCLQAPADHTADNIADALSSTLENCRYD